jgi:hypothetical protein
MITVKEIRAFISSLPDDTKMGIDDDYQQLVFRRSDSRGVKTLMTIGRLDAYGAYKGEKENDYPAE